MQDLEGRLTPSGLNVISTSTEEGTGIFAVRLKRVGRTVWGEVDLGLSRVHMIGDRARLVRRSVVEEVTTSAEGIRQDFLILERPGGEGRLQLTIDLGGVAHETDGGTMRLCYPSGRQIVWGGLRVYDATGRGLDARWTSLGQRHTAIVVDDRDATYPVTIDPTFTDADWESLGGIAGVGGTLKCMAAYGTGIVVGGWFDAAGDVRSGGIAFWNGSVWQAVPTTSWIDIEGIGVSGTDIYVSGSFTTIGGVSASKIACWDGSTWHPLGSGLDDTATTITIDGNDLYVTGYFLNAGGSSAIRIAKWDGSDWSPLGAGLPSTANAMASNGTDLCAVGSFGAKIWDGSAWTNVITGQQVNAVIADGSDFLLGGAFDTVRRWNGSALSDYGNSLGSGSSIGCMALYGGNLYVSGSQISVPAGPDYGFVYWDGNAWQVPADPIGAPPSDMVVNDGLLFCGGGFYDAGIHTAIKVTAWDGSKFLPLGGSPIKEGACALYYNDELWIGASGMGRTSTYYGNILMKWDGSTWLVIERGTTIFGVLDAVCALAEMDGKLYAGGHFTSMGGVAANNIAEWDGSNWRALGDGTDKEVMALASYGSDLYAVGYFSEVDGSPAPMAARYDGSSWHALGPGLADGAGLHAVAATESGVYVGGNFSISGGELANGIARWDGSNWQSLGTGLNGFVRDILVDGDTVYATGNFITAGSTTVNSIARWDGVSWHALGNGLSNGYDGRSLALFQNHLFLGGIFQSIDGVSARGIAHWDGTNWQGLGSGLSYDGASDMVVHDGYLYVTGPFTTAGSQGCGGVARLSLAKYPLRLCRVGATPAVTNQPVLDDIIDPESEDSGIYTFPKVEETEDHTISWPPAVVD